MTAARSYPGDIAVAHVMAGIHCEYKLRVQLSSGNINHHSIW